MDVSLALTARNPTMVHTPPLSPLLSMEQKAKKMRELGLTHFILTQTPLKLLPLQDLKRLVHWHKVDRARTTADNAILLLVPCTLLSTRTKFKRGTPGSN